MPRTRKVHKVKQAAKKTAVHKGEKILKNRIVIESVPGNLKEELINIADHLGNDLSSFLKPHLRKIIESYPAEYRLPFKDF